MRRNITLAVDDEIVRKARIVAARRNRSVSALVRDELARLVSEDEAYEAAKQAALTRLRRGTHLGGGTLPAREELHHRAGLR
jgi:predicted transcriptional regulator